MTPAKTGSFSALSREALQALDDLSGLHPGFRPAHAKGILLTGTFKPAPSAKSLTTAPHIDREETPVTARFSDSTGIPNIPDNHEQAGPRGLAIRFHLAEHVHTDIISHSVDAFPTRTPEEFVEFLKAAHASAGATEHPLPIERFLGSHPSALEFVQIPKPYPVSFGSDAYFAVSAYAFTNADGERRFGRYRIRPVAGTAYLPADAVKTQAPNYLAEELRARIAQAPIELRISVQIAAPGDVVDDATIHWPADREEVEFGVLTLTALHPNDAAEQQHIIFDPIPRTEGIEPSGDPLLDLRAELYLLSGRRRRAASAESAQ